MSQAVETIRLPKTAPSLRGRQIRAILALELRKNLLGWRALIVYLLGALPVLIMCIRALVAIPLAGSGGSILDVDNPGAASQFYSMFVFQGFTLRFVIFFGCVAVFTNLFRGEIAERSLHYYLLAPLRREVLAVGKYLSGLVSTGIVFTGATVVSYLLLYVPSPRLFQSHFLGGPGLSHLVAYVGITWLACLGYGAVFMLVGLMFKNPVIPAAFVFLWEGINSFLPAVLQKISIIYYLYALSPVPLTVGPLALIGDPISPWVAVPGLLLVCAALLGASALVVRRLEIRYGND
jgi:ABC-type transport system involved in multi-copper enzyme maturation permease subunit